MKRILLSLCFIVYGIFAFGQTDTEFWFAAPEVSQTSPYNLDRPVLLRVTAYAAPATVTVTQPAGFGNAMPPQTVSVAANSTVSVNLTNWLDSIECRPADMVLNRGLKITSTAPVTVYYEAAAPDNPEAFILKGRTALGNDFWIPSQNYVRNNVGTTPQALSAFDIVATENNTTVAITPANAIQGHAAGSAFTVVLNAGQTYSATAAGNTAADHLQGSRVTSDKPVAVTVKDDLLNEAALYLGTCGDLGGDQIVPVPVVGSEYIAMPGLLQGPGDQLFITATQNGTTIRQNGGPVLATINAGATYRLPVGNTAAYIQASAPVYVWQLSGMGCEMGLGLLPGIHCTGSSSVSFVRSTARNLYLNLMVKSGGQGGFLVNGVSGVITAAQFTAVPGTGGQWYTAQVSLPLSSYPQGSAISVVNASSLFHLGVLEGGFSGGTTYGYFSDFRLATARATAGSSFVCPGSAIYLYADTVASATYSWTGPNGFTSVQQNPVLPNVPNAASGVYTLTVDLPGCSSDSDTVGVLVKVMTVDLGADTTACRDSLILQSSVPYALPAYRWNTGDTTASLKVTASGVYWLEVQDEGCIAGDTIQVTLSSATVDLGPDTFFCVHDSILLMSSSGYTAPVYLWNTGATTPSLEADVPGVYWLRVDDGGCTGSDTVQVTARFTPVDLGPDFSVCADSAVLRSSSAYASPAYRWNTGAATPELGVTGSGTYWLEVTDNGCAGSDTVRAQLRTTPVELGPDTFFCGGTGILRPSGVYTAPTYRWSTGAISPQIAVTTGGAYWVEILDNGCTGSDTIQVTFRSTPVDLGADSSVCGDSTFLEPSAVYAAPAYRWNTGAMSRRLKVTASGAYWLEVTDNGCTGSDTIQVALDKPLMVDLGPDTSVCSTDTPVPLRSPQPPGARYLWSNGVTDTMIMAGTSGSYWLSVTLGACRASDTVQVNVVAAPEVFIGDDTVICEQLPLKLSTFVPGASYRWSTGSTGNTIYAAATGTYWLQVDLDGCIVSDTIHITAQPDPAIDLGPDRAICPAEVIILDAAHADIVSYRWSTGDTAASVAADRAGAYYVAATSRYGCTGYDTVYLEQHYLPFVSLGADTTVCEDVPLLLAPRTDADSLLWPDGSAGSTWQVSQGGSYAVKAMNECGTAADTILIRQIFCEIWLPNVFTPNGDGLNDVFRVLGNVQRMEGFSLGIFNRWGERIFFTADKYRGWDGRYKGREASVNTYAYMLRYSIDGIPYLQKGNFHLLR